MKGFLQDDKGNNSMMRLILLMNEIAALYVIFIGSFLVLSSLILKDNYIGDGTALISIAFGAGGVGQFFKTRQKKQEGVE